MENQEFQSIFEHFSAKQLGMSSIQTKVYEGRFQGRKIAIKRIPKNLSETAERETKTLFQVDNHENVIRYFGRESDQDFFYLGLELCEYNLHAFINDKSLRAKISTNEILQQAAKGLNHLHQLNISNSLSSLH